MKYAECTQVNCAGLQQSTDLYLEHRTIAYYKIDSNMAEEITTSLPSVKQENHHSMNGSASKDRKTEIRTYLEQSLTWEVADGEEWIQPEVIDTKSAGRRKVTLPDAATARKARKLKQGHHSHRSLSTEDMKLPKQNMNRSGVLNSSVEPPNRNSSHLSRSEPTSVAMPFVSPKITSLH